MSDPSIKAAISAGLKSNFGISPQSFNSPVPVDSLPSSVYQELSGPPTSAETNLNILTDLRPGVDVVNGHVNVTRIPIPFSNRLIMDGSQKYNLIIVAKEEAKSTIMRSHPYAKKSKVARYVALNIVVFNWQESVKEPMPNTYGDVLSADDVWSKWSVDGVCITEFGDSGLYTNERKPGGRRFNIIAEGFCRVTNIWGRNLQAGTPLFLILKKKTAPKKFRIEEFGSEVDHEKYLKEKGKVLGIDITPIPFQLVPYGDCKHRFPPREAIAYTDEFGYERMGKVIPIGVVSYLPSNQKYDTENSVYVTDVQALMRAGEVWINFQGDTSF